MEEEIPQKQKSYKMSCVIWIYVNTSIWKKHLYYQPVNILTSSPIRQWKNMMGDATSIASSMRAPTSNFSLPYTCANPSNNGWNIWNVGYENSFNVSFLWFVVKSFILTPTLNSNLRSETYAFKSTRLISDNLVVSDVNRMSSLW